MERAGEGGRLSGREPVGARRREGGVGRGRRLASTQLILRLANVAKPLSFTTRNRTSNGESVAISTGENVGVGRNNQIPSSTPTKAAARMMPFSTCQIGTARLRAAWRSC
jgi:hypothetical protein